MMKQRMSINSTAPLKREGGFTLIELMIAVAIIAILAAIALPAMDQYKQKSRRSDATSMLMQIAAKQEKFFMNNRSYAANLTNLGYGNTGATADPLSSEHDYYDITITAPALPAYTFTLTATPKGAQAEDTDCAEFNLDNEGNKTAEDDSGTDTTGACW